MPVDSTPLTGSLDMIEAISLVELQHFVLAGRITVEILKDQTFDELLNIYSVHVSVNYHYQLEYTELGFQNYLKEAIGYIIGY